MSNHKQDRRGGLLASLRRCRAGAIAVEFAFTFPIVIGMLMGVFEFGRYFWVQSSLQFAVTNVGRQIMTHYTREYLAHTEGDSTVCPVVEDGDDDDTNALISCVTDIVLADVEADASAAFLGWHLPTASFAVTKDGAGTGTAIEIVGTIPFEMVIPFFSIDGWTVKTQTKVPMINFGVRP